MKKKKKKSEGEHDKFLSESNKRIYPLGYGNYTNETIERKHQHCSIDIQPSKQPSKMELFKQDCCYSNY